MSENGATTTGGTSNESTEDTQQQNDETRYVHNENQQKRKKTYTDKYFEGLQTGIGGVLALQGEVHVQKRVKFDHFRDLLCNYVTTELKELDNVTCLIRDFEDPIVKYEKKKPKLEMDVDGKTKKLDTIEELLLYEKVKGYSIRLKIIRSNIQIIFGLIWGQCTSGL